MNGENAALRAWEPCPRCGTSNAPYENRCDKCGRRLIGETEWNLDPQDTSTVASTIEAKRAEVVTLPVKPPPNATNDRLPDHPSDAAFRPRQVKPLPEGMRRQLRGRVHAFRSKQLNRNLPLQFEDSVSLLEEEPPAATPKPQAAVAPSMARRAEFLSPAERVVKPAKRPRQNPTDQTELAFASIEPHKKDVRLMDVAPFRVRLLGHAIDFAITLVALLLFLLPIRIMVGHLSTSKFFLAGVAAAYLLLVLLYGFLFLSMAGATPSMKLLNLRIVNFDGFPAKKAQRMHRFLGAIAGVGSFFVGFLWAAVDEEGLAWQDRISKTFLSVSKSSSVSDA